MRDNLKEHWQHVYRTKQPNEVGWTQEIPATSLEFIANFHLPKDARIIDIGGGDSKLVDYLLEKGYTNIAVLDISAESLRKAQMRLGEKAKMVHWIEADIREFKPEQKYDLWHDRAAFHFLITNEELNKYLDTVRKAVDGFIVVGTFSENGPLQCSGLPIKQYSDAQLSAQFSNGFCKLKCITEDHITPFQTKQNFVFCSFKKCAA